MAETMLAEARPETMDLNPQITQDMFTSNINEGFQLLAPGSFGRNVACPLCDAPLGGLDVDDAPVKMTFAWDACASKHHFHAACLDARFDDSRPACPGCVAERLVARRESTSG